MQFHVLAYDGTEDGVLERRMAARDAHVKLISHYKEQGNILLGAALLDDDGTMIGSTIIVDFPSLEDVETWLREEPYVTNNVWEEVTITPCSIGPSFMDKF